MGKSLPSAARLQNFARIIASDRINVTKQAKPTSKSKVSRSISPEKSPPNVALVDPAQLGHKMEKSAIRTRFPLSQVVSDCVRRWFQDALREAKAGDTGMQLLVGQMYNSGYGVRKDTEKALAKNAIDYEIPFHSAVLRSISQYVLFASLSPFYGEEIKRGETIIGELGKSNEYGGVRRRREIMESFEWKEHERNGKFMITPVPTDLARPGLSKEVAVSGTFVAIKDSQFHMREAAQAGRTWITIASRGRSSAWKVSNKQPGYNASDSESQDLREAKS
ncbi:hypothetical protein Cgig2_023032 [Carnegiea gigantea]|uniref:Uncharacterized protein n=1 Tax=Carnegiea gigantea TaxID=171969 RepID=A0A9Q1QFQ6_9CARY|nr:hypothetical protein Cgig2_023032 [Carnegiea gigantea]